MDSKTFKDRSRKLRADRDFVLRAIEKNYNVLQHVCEDTEKLIGYDHKAKQYDETFFLEVIKRKPKFFSGYSPEELKEWCSVRSVKPPPPAALQEEEVSRIAAAEAAADFAANVLAFRSKIHSIAAIPSHLAGLGLDRKLWLQEIELNEEALAFAPEELRDESEFVMDALVCNYDSLQYAPPKFQQNDKFMHEVMMRRPRRRFRSQDFDSPEHFKKWVSEGERMLKERF